MFRKWLLAGLLVVTLTPVCRAERDELLAATREIMEAARYCALITLDSSGSPQARTMDAFAPEEGLVVWMGTNPASRKVRQIRQDPRVALYYEDPSRDGYVTLTGTAQLVDDPGEKARRWKPEWTEFYPDRDQYLLIKFTPHRLEVVSYRLGIVSTEEDWAVPSLTLQQNQ